MKIISLIFNEVRFVNSTDLGIAGFRVGRLFKYEKDFIAEKINSDPYFGPTCRSCQDILEI